MWESSKEKHENGKCNSYSYYFYGGIGGVVHTEL